MNEEQSSSPREVAICGQNIQRLDSAIENYDEFPQLLKNWTSNLILSFQKNVLSKLIFAICSYKELQNICQVKHLYFFFFLNTEKAVSTSTFSACCDQFFPRPWQLSTDLPANKMSKREGGEGIQCPLPTHFFQLHIHYLTWQHAKSFPRNITDSNSLVLYKFFRKLHYEEHREV